MKNSLTPSVIRQGSSRTSLLVASVSILILSFAGCRQSGSGAQAGPFAGSNPYASNSQQRSMFVGNQPVGGAPTSQQYAALAAEMQSLNSRLGAFDMDNQSLNTEVAALQQKLELANQYNQTLKMQLSETSNQIRQSEMAKQSALQRLAESESKNRSLAQGSSSGSGQPVGFDGSAVPSRFAGGATIRANNSLRQKLSGIQIPGSQVRMDGDVIRIEVPTDRLFVPGTYQIQPAQLPLLQNVSATIRQDFPEQIIGIEAHWDNTPLTPATTTHQQLTATQALAVFDNLVRLGIPQNQMFTMAMAGNRPRYPQGVSNGISANRRIELVIYPETRNGN